MATKIQKLAELAKEYAREINHSRLYLNMIDIIDELAGIAEAPLVVGTHTDIPPDSGAEEGYSDDYLIDVDGYRKHFTIGFYDHDDKRWILHDDDLRSSFVLEHMTWQRLPLTKYDDERS